MNEDAKKAEMKQIWESLKPDLEKLAERITVLYEASGSTRHCRTINELWQHEPSISIGFVPPEAIEKLEPLILRSGLSLVKGNGPLGKGVYFGFLLDAKLTPERLLGLGGLIEKETLGLKDAPPPPPPPKLTAEEKIEAEIARMEGDNVPRPEKIRSVPPEVGELVNGFNNVTKDMAPAEALKRLAVAIDFFHLPDISKHELLRTIAMMSDAESQVLK